MYLLLFVVLICFIVVLLKSIKFMDIFNPYLLFNAPIALQYIIYLVFYTDYKLRSMSLFCIGSTVIAYILGAQVCEKLHKNQNKKVEHNSIFLNGLTLHMLYVLAVIGFWASIVEFYLNGISGNLSFFINVRVNEVYGRGKIFYTKYSAVLLFISTLSYVYQYLWKKEIYSYESVILKKRSRKLIIMLILSPIFTLARTELLTYIFALSCLYYSFKAQSSCKTKLINFVRKYKNFLLMIFILIVLMYVIGAISGRTLTSNIFSKDFFLYQYIGFTIVTFDKYCINRPGAQGFLGLTGPLNKLLDVCGMYDLLGFDREAFILPSNRPNVVGYIGNVYFAIGPIGLIIFTFIIGYLMTLLYIRSRQYGGFYLIFYSSYIYPMVISFFAYQYANTFYIYIAILIMILQIDANGIFTYKIKSISEKPKVEAIKYYKQNLII